MICDLVSHKRRNTMNAIEVIVGTVPKEVTK